ncbi:MAG TPA: phosphatase PAP2 family protein [Acidimicrobiales bacterium]|nr:phosphatase PAP2 family protein [Acidimicrobiales bacterium]
MSSDTTMHRQGINRRDILRMGVGGTVLGAGALMIGPPVMTVAAAGDRLPAERCSQIEPTAGRWKTWVLSSGRDLRLPPPPDRAATEREIDVLETLVGQRDAAALDRIKFWDAGAAYRWAAIAIDRISTLGFGVNPVTKQPLVGLTLARNISLVMVAMYDATIAAWDSKYTYHRQRPNQFDHRLSTVIPDPRSPSYPSEHAAVGWAAATVLASLYPQIGAAMQALAQDEGRSRLLAGVEFPSDVTAGMELGQAVGNALVQRAKTDGADTPWTGTIPTVDPTGRGEPLWAGTNPIFPLAGSWKTWVLTSGNQFRPGAYPDFFSPAGMADLNQVVTFDRSLNGANFNRNAEAFFAQTTVGGILGEFGALNQRIQEERLADNPPRAARVNALLSVAMHDAMVACWDAKYFYWRIRPFQAHPGLGTLFPTPNHPSYPAAHGAGSGAAGAMGAYLFPRDAAFFTDNANQLAQSRLWAGIHYQSDIDVGLALGRTVAQTVIAQRANADGSQSAGAAAVEAGCSGDD